MTFKIFEKLKSEADRAGRSVNAELVGRLEKSLTDSSNEVDLRIIYEAIERLSLRNTKLRYSFGVNLGSHLGAPVSEIESGVWTLAPELPPQPIILPDD